MISSSAHLVELRQRLLVSFGSIFFFSVLSYFFAEHIARFFMTPLFASQTEVFKLVYTNLTEAFITYLKLSLLIGIIFSIPVLIYELWMFIAPGLHSDEKKTVLSVVFWATLLFSAGACFAFFIVLPQILHFFMGFASEQLTPLPKLSGYITFVARTSLAFGLAFEIPFLMVATTKIGWVSRNYFPTRRKFFYPAILILSVLLAAGDLVAAILLCLPLFALYETGIIIIRLFTKKTGGTNDDLIEEADGSD
jgi:sec-independent protein translocase protein TatC